MGLTAGNLSSSGDVADFVLVGGGGRSGMVQALKGDPSFGILAARAASGTSGGPAVAKGIAVPAEEEQISCERECS